MVGDVHVRCIVNVFNLVMKECLTEVHEHVHQINSLLSAIYSVKWGDMYESTQNQLGITFLPILGGCETMFINMYNLA